MLIDHKRIFGEGYSFIHIQPGGNQKSEYIQTLQSKLDHIRSKKMNKDVFLSLKVCFDKQ